MFGIDITRDDLVETAIFVGIVIAGVIIARIISALLGRIVHRFTHATETELDDQVVAALRRPLVLMIGWQAIFIGTRVPSYLDNHERTIERLWLAITLLVAVFVVQRIVQVLLTWYAVEFSKRTSTGLDEKTLPMVRRIVGVAIYGIGLVILLDQLGVSVSPLLAGLGLSGLAVALAIQPLLSNIFAGSYVLSDASVGVGDFIEIEGGQSGWVEDIGWRAARIRTFDNNSVVIPNATLAAATVTNFDTQSAPVGVPVVCGVAYEEDLQRVEDVVKETLQTIVVDFPKIVDSEYTPWFAYNAFGDSNIDFLMKLRANDRRDVGRVTHEMIKRVHARLTSEGITINYPARRLFLQEEDTSGLARLAGPNGASRAREA